MQVQAKTNDSKKAHSYLKRQPIRHIMQKAQYIYTLNEKIQSFLPAELTEHCWIINHFDDLITLGVDNAAWATQLRIHERDLIEKLRFHANLVQLKKIKYVIRPIKPKYEVLSSEEPTKHAEFPKQHRPLLRAIAQAVTDPALKKALLKLAR